MDFNRIERPVNDYRASDLFDFSIGYLTIAIHVHDAVELSNNHDARFPFLQRTSSNTDETSGSVLISNEKY